MGFDLRMPSITGATEREQLAQIRSYLYQFIPQLQWALDNIGTSSSNIVVQQIPVSQQVTMGGSKSSRSVVDAESTFNAIKHLIIKSADIVNAYYDEINARLEGVYVAESDFGSYAEYTTQDIIKTSSDVEHLFTNIQTILSDIENIEHTLIETNAHIKSGILYYDEDEIPIYGLEIGQRNIVDGEEVFNKFARFTADRLSFYDQNDTEVAYVSDYKLHITNAEIRNSLKIGGYKIATDNGLAFKWEGVVS